MINSRRISVVLPAYNAATTLLRTVAELDREIIDDIVLVDDASHDQTVPVARQIGLAPRSCRSTTLLTWAGSLLVVSGLVIVVLSKP